MLQELIHHASPLQPLDLISAFDQQSSIDGQPIDYLLAPNEFDKAFRPLIAPFIFMSKMAPIPVPKRFISFAYTCDKGQKIFSVSAQLAFTNPIIGLHLENNDTTGFAEIMEIDYVNLPSFVETGIREIAPKTLTFLIAIMNDQAKVNRIHGLIAVDDGIIVRGSPIVTPQQG